MYVFNFVDLNVNISVFILSLPCAALEAEKLKHVLFLCHEHNSSQNESINISHSKWNHVNYSIFSVEYTVFWYTVIVNPY